MGSMVWLLAAGAVVLVVLMGAAAVVVKVLTEGKRGGARARVGDTPGEALPYRAVDGLLTKTEAAFYHVLREAVEGEGVLCSNSTGRSFNGHRKRHD